jgi:hypothetical protein
MPEDIEVPIIGSQLEEKMVRPVPLIEYLFDQVFAAVQLKASRLLVASMTRVALDAQHHRFSVSSVERLCR